MPMAFSPRLSCLGQHVTDNVERYHETCLTWDNRWISPSFKSLDSNIDLPKAWVVSIPQDHDPSVSLKLI